jgi:hypothetical protein
VVLAVVVMEVETPQLAVLERLTQAVVVAVVDILVALMLGRAATEALAS